MMGMVDQLSSEERKVKRCNVGPRALRPGAAGFVGRLLLQIPAVRSAGLTRRTRIPRPAAAGPSLRLETSHGLGSAAVPSGTERGPPDGYILHPKSCTERGRENWLFAETWDGVYI